MEYMSGGHVPNMGCTRKLWTRAYLNSLPATGMAPSPQGLKITRMGQSTIYSM